MIKPVLVFYVSIFGLSAQERDERLRQMFNNINLEDELHANYFVFILPTLVQEHKVEMLNPNETNEEDIVKLKELEEKYLNLINEQQGNREIKESNG